MILQISYNHWCHKNPPKKKADLDQNLEIKKKLFAVLDAQDMIKIKEKIDPVCVWYRHLKGNIIFDIRKIKIGKEGCKTCGCHGCTKEDKEKKEYGKLKIIYSRN